MSAPREKMKPHEAASLADEEASWVCRGCSEEIYGEGPYCYACKDYFDNDADGGEVKSR